MLLELAPPVPSLVVPYRSVRLVGVQTCAGVSLGDGVRKLAHGCPISLDPPEVFSLLSARNDLVGDTVAPRSA